MQTRRYPPGKQGNPLDPEPDRRFELFTSLDAHQKANAFVTAALALGRHWATDYGPCDPVELEFIRAYKRLDPKGLPNDD